MPHAPYRGRFAPSPTGDLHAGSLLAALASWLRARQAEGQWLLRVEDIDPPREIAGSAASIVTDLGRLGLTADGPVMYQSARHDAYQIALDILRDKGLAFPCWCSRADLASGGLHRDGRCVASATPARPPAWRVRVPNAVVTFDDILQGPQTQNLRETVGDFVVRRADGFWAYQLACVVDDAAQGITEVVRGIDLMDSTARQIYLQRQLGLPTPRYLHIPLITDKHGRKLSKSDADQPLSGLPATALLRTALTCFGLRADTLVDHTVDALLAAAIQHVDLAHLPHRDRLHWPFK